MLKKIIKNLNIAIDIPFFFNGDPNKFQWESNQVKFKNELEKDILEPFQYEGVHFKAYDETYDLNFELSISGDLTSSKINKFPIIAYAYTEEGYKKIYQGINITPVFKLEKNVEIHLKLKIF